MNPQYKLLHPTYDEIHKACLGFVQFFEYYGFQFPRILGVSRGGLLPALILSHLLNIPMTPISYSSKAGKGDNKNHENNLLSVPITEQSVLLVDDICDSGNTLNEIKQHYENQGILVYTLVLFYKERRVPVIIPSFRWKTIPEDSKWVVFPFEQTESDGDGLTIYVKRHEN